MKKREPQRVAGIYMQIENVTCSKKFWLFFDQDYNQCELSLILYHC